MQIVYCRQVSWNGILQQPMRDNCNFLYKDNALILRAENTKTHSDFANYIRNNPNWICEIRMLSTVFVNDYVENLILLIASL